MMPEKKMGGFFLSFFLSDDGVVLELKKVGNRGRIPQVEVLEQSALLKERKEVGSDQKFSNIKPNG